MATETVTLSADRAQIALEGTWEIEGLLDLLIERSQTLEPSDLPLRGLAIRAKQLNSMLMSALGEEGMDEATLRVALTGQGFAGKAVAHHGC